MTDLFSPTRPDGRSEWRVVYDAAEPLTYGDNITFDELHKLLETDDRGRVHRAVGRCNRQFVHEQKPRVLGNIRGFGYKILRPGDYSPAALAYQKQARKKMTSAVGLMRAAPLDDMTPAARDWAHRVTLVLLDNELRLTRGEDWQRNAETRLAELERRTGVTPKVVEVRPEP